ncbi:MAG: hypothetical protein QG579_458 [Patescibacteria group bacterium]|jgi:hypothetical protein|nr:hypothetical protein [Patescibacteria group bacterium]
MNRYHQIHADISLPTKHNLLTKILSKDKLLDIHKLIGVQELSRIAGVRHDKHKPNWEAASEQEARDLGVIRKAITQVTGKRRPWIMGFASEFATALMTACQDPES